MKKLDLADVASGIPEESGAAAANTTGDELAGSLIRGPGNVVRPPSINTRRVAASAAALTAMLVLTGCTTSQPVTPEPTAAVWVQCQQPTAIVTTTGEPVITLTAAARRENTPGVASAGPSTTLLDNTVNARIQWEGEPVWAAGPRVQEALAEAVPGPVNGHSATVADVERLLSSVQDAGMVLGYASVDAKEVGIDVLCANTDRVHATVSTWGIVETGVLPCAGEPPAADTSPAALEAHRRFCK